MPFTFIRNAIPNPITLPAPYNRVLAQGAAIIVPSPISEVAANLGDLTSAGVELKALPETYNGPVTPSPLDPSSLAQKTAGLPPVFAGAGAVVGGGAAPVTGADAIDLVTVIALANETKAVVNSNNALLTAVQNGVNQNSGAITELQDAAKNITGVLNDMNAVRTSDLVQGSDAPEQSVPSTADAPTFLSPQPGAARNNTVEAELTLESVASLRALFATALGAPIFSPPTIVDDVVYIGDVTGKVSALAIEETGLRKLWDARCDKGILSSVAVWQDVCVAFDLSGHVYGLDRASGNILWKDRPNKHPAAGFFGGQGTIDAARGWIYVGVSSIQEDLMGFQNDQNGVLRAGSLSGLTIRPV